MGAQPLTAVLLHFLRVNAQMRNLDKQKTAQGRKTLVLTADNKATAQADRTSGDKITVDKYFVKQVSYRFGQHFVWN